jgi:hypothetical protein
MPSYAFITAALAFASTIVANPIQLGKSYHTLEGFVGSGSYERLRHTVGWR